MDSRRGSVRIKAKLFRGLADLSRLEILEVLLDGPNSVGEIARRTKLSQPNASQHLNCLRCCGLVLRERRGRRVYYRVASPGIRRLLLDADDLLGEVEARIRACRNYRSDRRGWHHSGTARSGAGARTRNARPAGKGR